MKTNKIFAMFAVAASMAALVSCQKEETFAPVQEEGISTITLTIEQPSDEDATKTVLGTETSGSYPINWSAGDKIAVGSQTGSTFEEYTLSSGAGSTSGTFTGTSISGAVYAYYPCNGVNTVSSTTYSVNIPAQQTYVAGSFGEGALPMYGIANSTADLHTLKPLMAVLKLPLKGTCKVSRIVVSSTSQKLSGTGTVTFSETGASLTVTGNDYVELICPDVQLSSEATLFHIAIPASAAGAYTVRVITDESKVLTKTLTVSSVFTAGKMKKTNELAGIAPTEVKYVEGSYCGDPVTIADITWAPVNCGYDATNYIYGKLYQFGRAVGCGYNDGETYQETVIQEFEESQTTTPADDKFYKGDADNGDWFSGSSKLSLWPMKSTDSGYSAGKIDNPCPEGWRVPTMSELDKLAGGDGTGSSELEGSGWDETNKGYWFNGTSTPSINNGLFLPAAGYRYYEIDGVGNRGGLTHYWSSSVSGGGASVLVFMQFYAFIDGKLRSYGNPVRCVKE